MPIVFPCPCGQPMRTGDEHAGKQVRCPKCSSVIVVPAQSVTIQKASPPNDYQQSFPRNRSLDQSSQATWKSNPPPVRDHDYQVGRNEALPTAERAAKKADEAFEVLESVNDLPTVERVTKRRKKQDRAPEGPRIRSIEEELYLPPPTFLGMDGGAWLRLFFVATTFIMCSACCAVSVASQDLYVLIPMAVMDLLIMVLVWVVLRVGR